MFKIHLMCAGVFALAAVLASGAETRRDLHGDPLPEGSFARIGTVRFRHVGEIDRVALSPDGKVLVTAATGNQPLRVWDAVTGALIREVPMPPDESQKRPKGARVPPESPAAITFANDAKRLHVLTQTGIVRYYDFGESTWSASLSRTGASGAGGPTSTGWATGDGAHFVFAPQVNRFSGIELFAIGRDTPPVQIADPDIQIFAGSISVSAGAGHVAALQKNGAIRIWDGATAKEVATRRAPEGVFYSVAISPDGKELVGIYGPAKRNPDVPASAVFLYGWDLATGKERFRISGWEGRSVTYHPNGRQLISFSRNDVLIVDAATGKLAHRMKGHGAWRFTTHSFGAGGKWLATGGYDHSAIIWDLEAGKAALDFDSPRGPVDVLVFSPDGKTLFTACHGDHTGGLWEADTGKRLHRLVADGKGGPMRAAFTADGRQLVVAYGQWRSTGTGKDWAARLWTVADGKFVREYGGHSNGVHLLALSADGKTLATREYDKAVRLWDFASGKMTGQFDWVPYNEPASMAFDGKGALVGAGYEGAAGTGVLDLISRKALTRWAGARPQSLVISPDGRLLAITETADQRRTVAVLDVRSGAVVQTLANLHYSSLGVVAFSADGRTIAVTDGRGVHAEDAVHVYDVATGKEQRTIRGHKGLIAGVAFSPDGRRLATGGWDSTALVWDLTMPAK